MIFESIRSGIQKAGQFLSQSPFPITSPVGAGINVGRIVSNLFRREDQRQPVNIAQVVSPIKNSIGNVLTQARTATRNFQLNRPFYQTTLKDEFYRRTIPESFKVRKVVNDPNTGFPFPVFTKKQRELSAPAFDPRSLYRPGFQKELENDTAVKIVARLFGKTPQEVTKQMLPSGKARQELFTRYPSAPLPRIEGSLGIPINYARVPFRVELASDPRFEQYKQNILSGSNFRPVVSSFLQRVPLVEGIEGKSSFQQSFPKEFNAPLGFISLEPSVVIPKSNTLLHEYLHAIPRRKELEEANALRQAYEQSPELRKIISYYNLRENPITGALVPSYPRAEGGLSSIPPELLQTYISPDEEAFAILGELLGASTLDQPFIGPLFEGIFNPSPTPIDVEERMRVRAANIRKSRQEEERRQRQR